MTLLAPYAAVLALVFCFLSIRTIGLRRHFKVALGDGGQASLQRAIRAHSNFAEYVPFALLLIFLVERQGASASVVHALCLTLLLARTIHAYGVSQVKEDFRVRVAGMMLTFACFIGSSTYLLLSAIVR